MNHLFHTVPDEIYRETLLFLPLKTINKVCQTDKYAYSICNNDKFWRDYLLKRAPEYLDKFQYYINQGDITCHQLTLGNWIEIYDEESDIKFPFNLRIDMKVSMFIDMLHKKTYKEPLTMASDFVVIVTVMYKNIILMSSDNIREVLANLRLQFQELKSKSLDELYYSITEIIVKTTIVHYHLEFVFK
jgi:hypothetical protein